MTFTSRPASAASLRHAARLIPPPSSHSSSAGGMDLTLRPMGPPSDSDAASTTRGSRKGGRHGAGNAGGGASAATLLTRHDLMLDEDLPRVLEAYFAVDEHRRMSISVAEGEEVLCILNVRSDPASLIRTKSQPDDDAAVAHLRRTALSAHLAIAANELDLIGSLLDPADLCSTLSAPPLDTPQPACSASQTPQGDAHVGAGRHDRVQRLQRAGSMLRHGSVSSVGFDIPRQYSLRRGTQAPPSSTTAVPAMAPPGAHLADGGGGVSNPSLRLGTTPQQQAVVRSPQTVVGAVPAVAAGQQPTHIPVAGGGTSATYPISFLAMMRLMFPSYPRKVVEKVVLNSLPPAPQVPARIVVDDTTTLLFRRCRATTGVISDSDQGTVSLRDIANGCRSLGMDERHLEQLVLKSSTFMKHAMLLDLQQFESRRMVDVLNHVGLPGYALLAQPQKYSPPLSMVNFIHCWDLLRPQLVASNLNSRQETRLSQLYVFAKQYGMHAAFKVQWTTLNPPVVTGDGGRGGADDNTSAWGAAASPSHSPLGSAGAATPFELSTNGSVSASLEIHSPATTATQQQQQRAAMADPIAPQGMDILTDLSMGVDGHQRQWAPPAADAVRLTITQLALLIALPRRAKLLVLPVVAPSSRTDAASRSAHLPRRGAGGGGGGVGGGSSAGGSRSTSALGNELDNLSGTSSPRGGPSLLQEHHGADSGSKSKGPKSSQGTTPVPFTLNNKSRQGQHVRRGAPPHHPIISGFRRFGALESPEEIFSALSSVVEQEPSRGSATPAAQAEDGNLNVDQDTDGVGDNAADRRAPFVANVPTTDVKADGDADLKPQQLREYPTPSTMRLHDKLAMQRQCKRDVGEAFNVPFMKQVQGLSVYAHMRHVATGVYPKPPPSVDALDPALKDNLAHHASGSAMSQLFPTREGVAEALTARHHRPHRRAADDYVVLAPRIAAGTVTKLSANEKRHTPQLFNFSCQQPPVVPTRPQSARPLPPRREIGDRSLCHVVSRPHATQTVAEAVAAELQAAAARGTLRKSSTGSFS